MFMKKAVLLLVCFVAFGTGGFAQRSLKGEKGITSIGGILGYAIDNETAVIGTDYRYNILDRLRLAPSLLYVFKKDNHRYFDSDANIWYFNADAHFLTRITEKATLYPIGGLGFSIWNLKAIEVLDIEIKDSETDIRLGLNLGFGGEIRLTDDIILGAEFRYNLTKRYYRQAMLLARVAYYF
jgi:opacity protein-like surface antigen